MSDARSEFVESKRRPRLVYLVTHAITARTLLRGHLAALRRGGFEVTLLCAPDENLSEVAAREEVELRTLQMRREMAPLRDAAALLRCLQLLRELKPDVVVAGTPKAGLLGMLAARLLGVPARVYVLRGLRLETARGWQRSVLRAVERLALHSATDVLAVSSSLRQKVIDDGLIGAEGISVPGPGSSNGVDTARFRPPEPGESEAVRRQLGLPPGAPVVGFVGRLTRDKGIADLLAAFKDSVLPAMPDARLLVVGGYEAGDPVSRETQRALDDGANILVTGFVDDPAGYYAAMDVLAFPSYREGFPNVPLEVAAAGKPIVAYGATGTIDAVRDGESGRLVELGDAVALGRALVRYLADPQEARAAGAAGRRMAESEYAVGIVQRAWTDRIAAIVGLHGVQT